jgi:hypothetical protein
MAGDGVWAANIFLRNSALQCVRASLRPFADREDRYRSTEVRRAPVVYRTIV